MTHRTTDDDRIWKALADMTRREILDVLREGPQKTGDLCERFEELSRTAVMKHIDLLVDAGLVVIRREGRCRWNHLNGAPLQEIYDRWMSPYMQQRASAVSRLKHVAEQLEDEGSTEDKQR